jgi:hypothetical protein
VEREHSGSVLPAGLPVPARGPRPASTILGRHLYAVGGLYGNLAALGAILRRAELEPDGQAAIVRNGDFHWLDVDPEDFRTIGETVLAHHATKGNVEAELASTEDAGCGCAYPRLHRRRGRPPS